MNTTIENQVMNTVNLTMLEGLHTGQVKWFNRRRGYGFIRIIRSVETEDTTYIGKDVFVHQSHITPKQSTYRTLEDNEYVEFGLSLDEKNTTQAVNVTGIMNGTLLCDAHVDRQKYLSRKEQDEATLAN
jgi:cold shock CspA family protein